MVRSGGGGSNATASKSPHQAHLKARHGGANHIGVKKAGGCIVPIRNQHSSVTPAQNRARLSDIVSTNSGVPRQAWQPEAGIVVIAVGAVWRLAFASMRALKIVARRSMKK